MASSPSDAKGGGELDTALESFRQQWISDLRSRADHEHHETPQQQQQQQQLPRPSGPPQLAPTSPSRTLRRRAPHGPPGGDKPGPAAEDINDDYLLGRVYDEPSPASSSKPQGSAGPEKQLLSALDHYEEAMAKEASGNMGDSLKLYRRAYRLDSGVDRRYREKHFPKHAPKSGSSTHPVLPTAPAPSQPAPPPQTATDGPPAEETKPLSFNELIASFAQLRIEPAPPEVEGAPAPPSPFADLPDEILMHVLRDVADEDVADFARISCVCKRLAYLVATEQRIWQQVTTGDKVGFAGMVYRFQRGVDWDALPEEEQEGPEIFEGVVVSPRDIALRLRAEQLAVTTSLTPAVYPTWKAHFRNRPRIRFNGCYISTVNYVRTGQASTNQATWGGAPVHIVTYYRYLRFFRDGTLISLLSTNEPGDVVHHLTRDDLQTHRGAAHPHLPSAVMALALRGRWRLSSSADRRDDGVATSASASASAPVARDSEGDIFIETEGVSPKYIYRLDLSMRSAGKGGRNNKLAWRGFYNYNKLTDDWGEFGLKNDKPFFFSRVKSYGYGE